MKPRLLPGRSSLLTLPVVLLALLPACAVRPLEVSVDDITRDLVAKLQQREDLNKLRILVLGFHRTSEHNPWVGDTHEDPAEEEGDAFAILLGHEFVIALSSLANVVESEYAPVLGDASPASLADLARRFDVDAVLAGDYTVQNGTVVISARVIDARSAVILAATKGSFPVSDLPSPID